MDVKETKHSFSIIYREAEFVALSSCESEACWLRNLFIEMKVFAVGNHILISEDNQSAIKVCKSLDQQARGMKHLDNKHHFIKDKVREGIINIDYVPTQNQIADMLTKPLNCNVFKTLRGKMFNLYDTLYFVNFVDVYNEL